MQDACGRTAIVVGQGTSAVAADWTGLGRENAGEGISVVEVVIIAVALTTDVSAG